MRVIVYAAYEFLPMKAFAAGVEACGDRVVWRNMTGYGHGNYEAADVVAVFGMKEPSPLILSDHRAHGTPVVVVDLGYVRRGNIPEARRNPDGVYWSAGLNGLNGHANFKNVDSPGERWEELGVQLRPWRVHGSHILVCGQKPSDAAMLGVDARAWAVDTLSALRACTDRPVIFRPHPQDTPHRVMPGVRYSVQPRIEDDLTDCWAVVAYNSNALVDATISGVPSIALGPGSMVDGIAATTLDTLEELPTPDREQWSHNLAYCQWTLPEFEAGSAWRHLIYGDSIRVRVREESAENGADHGSRRGRSPKARLSRRDQGEPALSAG